MAIVSLSLTSCSIPGPSFSHRFAVRPFGQLDALEKTKPQTGARLLTAPTRRTFREITIAQGSGRSGFESIRIFADGRGYAIVSISNLESANSRAIRVPIHLSSRQLDELMTALQSDQLHRIKGRYSSGLADGAQGFMELVTSRGRVYASLDNYFEPVTHTYKFCNAQIWPLVLAEFPRYRFSRRHGLQEEYDRVFEK